MSKVLRLRMFLFTFLYTQRLRLQPSKGLVMMRYFDIPAWSQTYSTGIDSEAKKALGFGAVEIPHGVWVVLKQAYSAGHKNKLDRKGN